MVGASALTFKSATTADEFVALSEQWNRLAQKSGNIFLDHAWLRIWLDVYGQECRPHVLTAWRGQELVAALPLVIQPRPGVRRMEFMGSGSLTPNHVDVLARPEIRDEALVGFAGILIGEIAEWDSLDFDKLAADAHTDTDTLGELRQAIGRHQLRSVSSVSAVCPYIDLPDSYEEFSAGLSPSLRKSLRFKLNRMRRECTGVEFRRATTEDEVASALDALESMHQARWRAKGHAGALADPRFGRFHHALALESLKAGSLRLDTLVADGANVAIIYAFRVDDCVQFYLPGFDEAWQRHSPGLLLLRHAIESAIGEGATVYDFLQGQEAYKDNWPGAHKRLNVRLQVFSPTPRGALARAASGGAESTIALARRLIPESIRLSVRKQFERLRARENS